MKKRGTSKGAAPPPALRHPGYFTIDLYTWRKTPTRVNWLQALHQDRTFREFLSVLHNQTPVVSAPTDTPDFMLGRINGYREALAVMAAAANHEDGAVDLGEPDYLGEEEKAT